MTDRPKRGDPTFETREELEDWRGRWSHKQTLRFARGRDRSARNIGNKLRRVTLAHAHLLKGQTDD